MKFNKICPQCNQEFYNIKYCENCGTQNKDIPPPPPPPEPFIAPPTQNSQNTSTRMNNTYNNDYRELNMFYNTLIYLGRLLQNASKILGGLFFFIGLLMSLGYMTQSPMLGIGIIIAFVILTALLFGPLYIAGLFMTILPLLIRLFRETRDAVVSIDLKLKHQ